MNTLREEEETQVDKGKNGDILIGTSRGDGDIQVHEK
jgi:hypothetical protein